MWEAVLADMRELEANFASAKKERELKGGDCPPSLLEFLDKCEKRISALQAQYKTASVSSKFRLNLFTSFTFWYFQAFFPFSIYAIAVRNCNIWKEHSISLN